MSSLNPSSTLYRETPCPIHGGIHEPIEGACAGGSREVVTIDYEAAWREWVTNPSMDAGTVTERQFVDSIVDAALGE